MTTEPMQFDLSSSLPIVPSMPLTHNHHHMQTRSKMGTLKSRLFSSFVDSSLPTCYSKVVLQLHWCDAMNAEFSALLQIRTWELVSQTEAQNVICCKWVFRIKQKSDNSVERYKTRLVVKRFHQRPGVDFTNTYSPVLKPKTLRVILPLVFLRWLIKQLDVFDAFSHGDLNDCIFMEQPLGFIDSEKKDNVCYLKCSFYRLKQAPRQWYHKLMETLHSLHFQSFSAYSSLFTYHNGSTVAFCLVYVDDILLTRSNPNLFSIFHYLITTVLYARGFRIT